MGGLADFLKNPPWSLVRCLALSMCEVWWVFLQSNRCQNPRNNISPDSRAGVVLVGGIVLAENGLCHIIEVPSIGRV
jgi:hypothetical protein